MLLKDCPVGSVVRLDSLCGSGRLPIWWRGNLEVKSTAYGPYVVDGDGAKRDDIYDDPDFQFEIIRPAPEPRITFTVGGQEFYVGQRVWASEAGLLNFGKIIIGDALIVVGEGSAGGTVAARVEENNFVAFFKVSQISTTPPTPHEWKRGDWARHNEFGECFVCSGVDFAGEVRVDFVGCSASVRYETLTFIKHIDLPS